VFCSRTCRLETIRQKGLDYAKELGRTNAQDLAKLVKWNEEHNIKFMRISSEMFPFASHKELGYDLDYAKEDLKAVGDLAKELGHRLTLHPGQFNQLGSKTESVVESTFRDLKYHSQILDYMGLDQDSVMILHMGGVYGDRDGAIARWEENFQKLDKKIADRIVLENDEISYNTEQILPTCKRLNIPLVFDWHHHSINPGTVPLEELLPEIAATWTRRGIRQKQHYSESRLGAETPMERRAHSDRVKSIPNKLDEEVDLMIEAKDKEQAVLTVYRDMGLFKVAEGIIWDPLPETKRVVDKHKKPKKEGEDGEDAPKKKRVSRKKKAVKKTDSDSEETSDVGSDRETKKKRTTRKKKAVKDESSSDQSDVSEEDAPKKKRKSPTKKTSKESPKKVTKKTSKVSPKKTSTKKSSKKAKVESESEQSDEEIRRPIAKKRSSKKVKAESDISDVEHSPKHDDIVTKKRIKMESDESEEESILDE